MSPKGAAASWKRKLGALWPFAENALIFDACLRRYCVSKPLNSFHFITLLRPLHWIADDVLLRGGRRKFQVVLAGQRGRPESRRKFGENLKHFLPFHFSPVWKEVTAVPLLISIADQYNIATLKDWLFWPKEGKHVDCLTQLACKFVFLNTKDIAGQSARKRHSRAICEGF